MNLTPAQSQTQLGAYDAAVRLIGQGLSQAGLNQAEAAIKSLSGILELAQITQAAIDAGKDKP